MTITIRINTSNAAFDNGNKDKELARIVHEVAHTIEEGGIARGVREAKRLYDYNGNHVGSVTITGT